ncbi:MAG: SH3 domain-containing protein [Spirochaetes bacterium]|nr:SH3 domain-containing protein [Spirochaetota bacterium]
MESKTITTISYDEQVTVIEKLNTPSVIDKKEGYWTKIKYSKHEGWVFGAYLRKDSEKDFLEYTANYLNQRNKTKYYERLSKSNEFLREYYKQITNISTADITIIDFSHDIFIIKCPAYSERGGGPVVSNEYYAYWFNGSNWIEITGDKHNIVLFENDNTVDIISLDGECNFYNIDIYRKSSGNYLKFSDICFSGDYNLYKNSKNELFILNTGNPEIPGNILYKYSPKEHKFIKTNEKFK